MMDMGSSPTIHGANAGSRYAGGIGGQYGNVVGRANALGVGASNALAAPANSSYSWGQRLGLNFASGLSSSYYTVYRSAAAVAAGASAALTIRSPAKKGPLSEDASIWGRKLGRNFAYGLRDSVSAVASAAAAVGGAAIPRVGPMPISNFGLGSGLLGAGAGGRTINFTGPLATDLLGRLGLAQPPAFLRHVHADVAGVPCHVMRLSFTGEVSYELHHPVDRAVELWRVLLAAGHDLGIAPHGLQALQGLRLEKGHVIVGMDSELDSTPRRLGMDWAVRMDKPEFVGRAALERTAGLPDARRLAGFTMPSPAPAEGSPVTSAGEIVGHVSSSFTSPVLGRAVMLGWLKRSPFPTEVEIDGRPASVVSPPFYDPEGVRARA